MFPTLALILLIRYAIGSRKRNYNLPLTCRRPEAWMFFGPHIPEPPPAAVDALGFAIGQIFGVLHRITLIRPPTTRRYRTTSVTAIMHIFIISLQIHRRFAYGSESLVSRSPRYAKRSFPFGNSEVRIPSHWLQRQLGRIQYGD